MKRSNETLVGLVILAGLALVAFGMLWLQDFSLQTDRVQRQAVFEDVGLIRPGSSVTFRGMRVGRVRELHVATGGDVVRVSFDLDDAVPLPDDAAVVLSPESMFGDWQAQIVSMGEHPGHRFAEPVEPDDLPGYALPDISELTATADQISGDIEVLTERVGVAFSEETAENIASLIRNVEDVTNELSALVSQQAESFADVTDEVRGATQEIGSAATRARESFETVSGTLSREDVDAAIEDLAVVAANFRALSEELDDTNEDVRRMAAQVDTAFVGVNALVVRAEEGEGSIGRLLQDPTMATELEGTLRELQVLLADIRENPRRYLRLSIF